MYLQIGDPSEAPVPPEEVRIKAVDMQPYRDSRRIRTMLKLTSFQSPPDIFVHVEDARGMEVSSLSIIGATEATMSLTIHIRDPEAEDPYEVKLTVSYEEQGTVDERIVPLSLTRGEQLG